MTRILEIAAGVALGIVGGCVAVWLLAQLAWRVML